MELFPEIIDLGKDLIEKYSLIPVDIDKYRMFLVRSRAEVLEIFIRYDDVNLTLYRKEVSSWARYRISDWLLESSRSGEFIFEYGRIPKDSLSEKEITLLFINKFLFEILRRAGDRLFDGPTEACKKDYRLEASPVSSPQAALLEKTVAKYIS